VPVPSLVLKLLLLEYRWDHLTPVELTKYFEGFQIDTSPISPVVNESLLPGFIILLLTVGVNNPKELSQYDFCFFIGRWLNSLFILSDSTIILGSKI
jgi:hypothetical protein